MAQEVTKKKEISEHVRKMNLDLKTRLCLIAALVFEGNTTLAIQNAVDIENAADAMVRKMKKNYIPPRGTN